MTSNTGAHNDERHRAEYATVITEEGAWGSVPPRYRPPEQRSGAGAVWWVGALLALTGMFWLGALSLSQLSSRTVAMPAIERGVTALTEIDRLLAIHEDGLCALAASGAAVNIMGLPIQGVDIQVDDVHCIDGKLDREDLRARLLSNSAQQIYLHGADAFLDDAASDEGASILSASGAIRATLDSVGASMHDRITTTAWVLSAVNGVLIVAVLLLGRGIRRFAGLGMVLVIAAAPMLLGALISWLVLGTMDSGAGLTAQFAQLSRSLLSLPLRNALWLTGAGIALIVPVLVVDALLRRSRRMEWWEYSR